MADITDFDLDRSTAEAWTEFQARLSEVVSVIDGSGDLTIGTQSGAGAGGPFVRFTSPAPDLIRSEAAGNDVLGPHFQLTADQQATLQKLGWKPMTDAEGSSYAVELPQEDSDQIAALAVAALKDVYGVQHPVFLAPDQLAEILQPEPAPLPVPVDRSTAIALPDGQQHLDQLIDETLTAVYGHRPIRDSEGDVAIRVGSTMLFCRASPDGQEIVIFAAVVHEVEGRSRAAEVLNDLNVEARWVKFQLVRDRVFVTFSILARPFVAAHLRQALLAVSSVADGIDDDLAVKLKGRTTFRDDADTL